MSDLLLVRCLLFFFTTVCFYFRLEYTTFSPLSLVLIPRSIPVGFQYCPFFNSSFLSSFCFLLLHFLPFSLAFFSLHFSSLLSLSYSYSMMRLSSLLSSLLCPNSPLICSLFHTVSPLLSLPLLSSQPHLCSALLTSPSLL